MTDINAIKLTGKDCASEIEVTEFNRKCKDKNLKIINFVVTDEEHEILSLTAKVSFVFSTNKKTYNNIIEGYEDLVTNEDTLEYIHDTMYSLNLTKFEQHEESRQVLMSTNGPIIYKTTDDNYWGSRVPEFDGQNLAGQMLVDIREYLKE